MNIIEKEFPEARFGGYSDIDGTVAFYGRINSLLQPEMIVLDVGCGRGGALLDDKVTFRRNFQNLKGKVQHVIGIDVDPIGDANPGIDEFRLLHGKLWPVATESVDLIVSDFVLEHISEPNEYFKEVFRVLKPNGFYCARTSNKFGYVGLVARLIPEKKHKHVLGYAQKDRVEHDVFPTLFRANTISTLRKLISQHGLVGVVYGFEAEPSYLGFSPLLYKVGKIVHSVTPNRFRNGIFIFARKP
jgi:SAM-dependent methyltransferase